MIVLYNFNVVLLLIRHRWSHCDSCASSGHSMLDLSGLYPNHLFWPSLFPRVGYFSFFSASSIKHQVASVILHVTTGLAPLRRLASGLSPVNKTTTATAVVMIATATRLRIVQPLLKCSKICGNDRKIRLRAHRKTMSCTSPLSTGPTG
jgi:hypothetical protein